MFRTGRWCSLATPHVKKICSVVMSVSHWYDAATRRADAILGCMKRRMAWTGEVIVPSSAVATPYHDYQIWSGHHPQCWNMDELEFFRRELQGRQKDLNPHHELLIWKTIQERTGRLFLNMIFHELKDTLFFFNNKLSESRIYLRIPKHLTASPGQGTAAAWLPLPHFHCHVEICYSRWHIWTTATFSTAGAQAFKDHWGKEGESWLLMKTLHRHIPISSKEQHHQNLQKGYLQQKISSRDNRD